MEEKKNIRPGLFTEGAAPGPIHKDLRQILVDTLTEASKKLRHNNRDNRTEALDFILRSLIKHKEFADKLGFAEKDINPLINAYRRMDIDSLLESPGGEKYYSCFELLSANNDDDLIGSARTFFSQNFKLGL